MLATVATHHRCPSDQISQNEHDAETSDMSKTSKSNVLRFMRAIYNGKEAVGDLETGSKLELDSISESPDSSDSAMVQRTSTAQIVTAADRIENQRKKDELKLLLCLGIPMMGLVICVMIKYVPWSSL